MSGPHETSDGEKVRGLIDRTLQDLRECLHRSGSLSSRQEALDEVGKLLFAHIVSIGSGGPPVSTAILHGRRKPGAALRQFVDRAFRAHLPRSLAHELQPGDFALRLKVSENLFAEELLHCFDAIASPETIEQVSGPEGVDILNDTFGQFLAHSFVDEKELGQYLTPIEVVRFMVRLGIDSLDTGDRERLVDPERCASAGVILDPSCGVGSFLVEVLRVLYPTVRQSHDEAALRAWLHSMMCSVLAGIDKSERMIRLALTNLALFGVSDVCLHHTNALIRSGPEAEVSTSLEGRVKLILTNPPFGAEFPAARLGPYRIATDWTERRLKSVDSEVLFMERYVDWLAPGGHLVAIVPDSILTHRGLFADLRRGLEPLVELRSVISLPAVTFGVAGTHTKTSILHLRKRGGGARDAPPVYYAICGSVGYDVQTRDAQRRKVANDRSELADILSEALRLEPPLHGRLVELAEDEQRWDATYHASLPSSIARRLAETTSRDVFVRDVAQLSSERVDPRKREPDASFRYIEIADVDAQACTVQGKTLRCADAPIRARRPVRAGDVLVSTVRPERRTVAVVPRELDGAICSTGFAVLRCTGVHPLVLASLLQSDFANAQLLRNNVGIAYPAIDEECLLDVLLPCTGEQLESLACVAEEVRARQEQLMSAQRAFRESVADLAHGWSNH